MNRPADPVLENISPAMYAHRVVRQSGTSFFWGMRLLPEERRQAMYAIYAFCREVDDIADSPGEAADKLRALESWREEIDLLYRGQPKRLTSRALLEPVDQFDLPQEEFHAIVDGMEIDAAPVVRIRDVDSLLDYCRKVAGAVGMLSIRVFGLPQKPGPRIAVALGNALQLTNILRDVKSDAARNRLYVPSETLAKYSVDERSLSRILVHPSFAGACLELSRLARRYYLETEWLLKGLRRGLMRPAVIMMKTYQETLNLLETRGWKKMADPVSLKSWRKIWLALRHGVF